MRRQRLGARWGYALLALVTGACASADWEGRAPDDGDNGGIGGCFRDADCPTGLSCVDFRCVAGDGAEPEKDADRTFLRPEASGRYVFALSPDSDSVAVVDPAQLSIHSIELPPEPMGLGVIPGRDAAVIVSRQGRAVSLLSLEDNQTVLRTQRTARRYPALTVSADGRWAVLWTPEGEEPDAGAEGIVALVDLTALATGETKAPLERAAGRRHTDVFFRLEQGVAVEAVIVGKDELSVIDLNHPENQPIPDRIRIPEAFAEILTRKAVSPPGGEVVILRSLGHAGLAVFDVENRTHGDLSLPAPATDLDLADEGRLAVAVLRENSQVAWFPLPETLSDDSLVQVAEVVLPGLGCEESPCEAAAGQAEVTPDGRFAALFTTARRSPGIAWFDFATGELASLWELQKEVRAVGIGPDGRSAIVLHRANPQSTLADLYERMVDRSEGYSIVDLERGHAQLKLTEQVAPKDVVFAPGSRHAAVTLRDDARRVFRVEAIDLSTLVTDVLHLASAPQFAGPMPGASGDEDRVWVTQIHPAGRISIVSLGERAVRTATGYALNSRID